jgi:hypothetical protein
MHVMETAINFAHPLGENKAVKYCTVIIADERGFANTGRHGGIMGSRLIQHF